MDSVLSLNSKLYACSNLSMPMTKSNEFGVHGWVRNSHKYDLVEAVFQGEKKKVDLVVDFLKSSPYGIRVENVTLNEVKTDEKFDGFEIRY